MISLDYQLIETQEALNEVMPLIAAEPLIGIDTEFDSNRLRYGMNLCVIQIATPAKCYIIDPLAICAAGGDKLDFERLRPVWDLVASEHITKILFAGSEDLQIFALYCRPAAFYDLSLAARVLGLPQNSFADMVGAYIGLQLDKGEQCANWYIRPLTAAMIDYLVKDVAYLFELKTKMDELLDSQNRRAWFDEENALLLANATVTDRQASMERYAETKFKVHTLPDYQRFVIKELIRLRDDFARQMNLPEYYIFRNERLLTLADEVAYVFSLGNPNLSVFTTGVHRKLQQGLKSEYLGRLQAIYDQAEGEGLSTTKNTLVRSRGEYVDRQELNDFIDRMEPVRLALAARHGETLQALLLSKALLKKVFIAKSFEALKGYARREVEAIAAELGLSLDI